MGAIDILISEINLQPFHPVINILKYYQGFSRFMDANAVGWEESTILGAEQTKWGDRVKLNISGRTLIP